MRTAVWKIVWVNFMNAWHKCREFLLMVEHKQQLNMTDILYAENKIQQINEKIERFRQEFAYTNQQIKTLTPSGVLARSDLYKGIRQQGALITHQQLVIHQITLLEDELQTVQQKLEQLHLAKGILDKKHHKLTYHMKQMRSENLRRQDNNMENELQELAVYGKKYH